jgi:PKD repeat protein
VTRTLTGLIVASLLLLGAGCGGDDGPGRVVDKPVASFTYTYSLEGRGTFCVVRTVSLTDTSTGMPTSWKWAFDDGTSSTERNPTWENRTGGSSLAATLTATNAAGSDSHRETVDFPIC